MTKLTGNARVINNLQTKGTTKLELVEFKKRESKLIKDAMEAGIEFEVKQVVTSNGKQFVEMVIAQDAPQPTAQAVEEVQEVIVVESFIKKSFEYEVQDNPKMSVIRHMKFEVKGLDDATRIVEMFLKRNGDITFSWTKMLDGKRHGKNFSLNTKKTPVWINKEMIEELKQELNK